MASTPLVGRDDELTALGGALRDATDRAATVLVTGDAGVGKTRLVTEFGARPPLGARFLLGRGSARGAAVPFGLLVEALDPALRRLPADDLDAFARGRGRGLAGIAPSLPVEERPEAPSRLAVLDAVAAAVEAIAADRPTIVALDDVHQADPSTREAIDYLARNPPSARALLIATARSEALASDPGLTALFDALRKDDLARSVAVRPLDRTEVEQLIAARRHDRDPSFAGWIWERARGNPLLTVGLLEGADDDPAVREVPVAVKERVRHLVGPLDAGDRSILELAAVLGHAFTLETAATLLDDPGQEQRLDQLVRAGLLVTREDDGVVIYDFVHPLVQEATYDGIGAATRRGLHARIAERGAREPIDVRAYHVARGALPGDGEAVAILREAARSDEAKGSHREALTHLRAALRLLDPTDDAARVELLREIAWQAAIASDHTIGIPAIRELEPLLEDDPRELAALRRQLASFLATGEGDLEGAAAAADDAVRLIAAGGLDDEFPRVLNELAWIKGEGGDLRAQIEGSGEAIRLAERGGDPITAMHARGAHAHALGLVGRTREAEITSRAAIETARGTGESEQIGWHTGALADSLMNGGRLEDARVELDGLLGRPNPSDVAYFSRARLDWHLGRWELGLTDCDAIRAMHPISPSIHSAWTLTLSGAILGAMGRPEEAAARVRLADRIYGEGEFYVFSAYHRWSAGWVAWLASDLDGATARLARAAAWLEAMRAWPVLAQILPDLIEVRVEAGELGAAERDAETMDAAIGAAPDPFLGAHRAYVRGLLAGSRGRTEDAMAGFAEARNAAAGLGARLLGGRAAERLGTVSSGRDRLDALTEAGRLFASFPAAALEARVDAALRREGGAGRRAAQTIGELTPREREVAALARRGLTAREIAAQLHLSPRTVESHLAHVYAKLGIASREELIRTSSIPAS